ncbi:MAG: extracellular solute-binding protein [Clostridia bacterium]|nr:extracellular solute-binding protein [Clostridia bacterium]
MKKKFFTGIISLLMMIVMAFSFAACGTSDSDEGETGGLVSLKLWTPITGADLTVFNRMITRFNQSHEGEIHVDHQSDVRDTHYQNLKNNIPNNGPDIAIIHSQLVKNYAENDYIVPIDSSFFTKETINPDDYQQNVMSTLKTSGGEVLGFPLDVHPIVLYYNKSIVGDNPLPTNFTELMQLAQKLTDTSKGIWGLPISTMWPTEFTYTTALYQAGGEEIDVETSMPKFNTDAGAKAAENLRDIIFKYKVSPENLQTDADLGLFTTGKAAFHIQGCWNLTSFMEVFGDDLGVMSLSGMLTDNTDAASKYVMARSHCFTVAKTKRALSQRKKEAIVTFIKWMGENSAEWSSAGQIPAFNAARESDTFKNAPYVSQYGDPSVFRTAASATYFESGYETVFQYVTTIMKSATSDIQGELTKAEAEAKRAVNTEMYG